MSCLYSPGSWRKRCQSWCDREHTGGRSQTAPEMLTHIVVESWTIIWMYTDFTLAWIFNIRKKKFMYFV